MPSSADPRQPGVALRDTGTWTRFGGYYAYDPAAARVVDTKLQPQGRYDNPGDLVSTEVKVKSHDGTLVPLSIVHRKGIKLDGTNPTILYGYGAYGISQTPFFRPQYLAWFERGGVFAVAHVRGGGENGEEWYKGGYQQTKPNTWRDAIACAEWLVANGYDVAGQARDRGRQPGRHLRRPLDHRAARSLRRGDRAGPGVRRRARHRSKRTASSTRPKSGRPRPRRGFRALLAMSPYHHIKDGVKYPAVLVTTGINDPRVDAWQAAKMAARLAGGDDERQARAAARRFRRGPRLRLDQEAAQRGARRHARLPAVAVRREGLRCRRARARRALTRKCSAAHAQWQLDPRFRADAGRTAKPCRARHAGSPWIATWCSL